MAKYRIDDILSELGLDDDGSARRTAGAEPAKDGKSAPKAKAPAGEEAKKRKPEEPASFSPLPSAPANQKKFGDAEEASGAPAAETTGDASTVGQAFKEIYTPGAGGPAKGRKLGEILLASGGVTEDKIAVAEQVIRQSPGRRLADVLIEQGIDEAVVRKAEAEAAGVPFERVDLGKGLDGGFDGKLLQRLTPEFCKQNHVLPLRTEGNRVIVGATRTDDVSLLDELRTRLGGAVKLVMIPGFDVRGALEIVGEGEQKQDVDISSILSEVEETDVQVAEKKGDQQIDLEKEAGESPVIRYVNYIIQNAVKEGASDIHIEPSEKKVKVRFRIDGELFEMMNPPASMGSAITSRLKIMANLDISERRLPQDGRIRCMVQGRKLDLRMSTLPTPTGEKTVMRILDTKSINVDLDKLGFADETLTIWQKMIDLPHGIVLVTGPTGSGKTTTLYASLRKLDKNSMNISTVEDPVEYHLDGITQTQTHEKIGMTFALALRALLRQDPDVIMLGEIRDMETALIAVQAALTGHLVLSTLHTNDAPSSITRLINIGLEPFLIGAAVNAVLAQRLIRRLCVSCKAEEPPSADVGEFLAMQGMEPEFIWTAKGCDKCRKTGYSGRVGIYELLAVDDQLRDVIARNPNVAEFRRMCIERGMVTLRQDGMKKVVKGLTTIQEVLRVTDGAH